MSQATYVDPGETIDFTPGTSVAVGAVVVQGDLVGVARAPLTAQRPGSLLVRGVFDVVKSAEGFAVGQAVWWNPAGLPVGGSIANGSATATPTGIVLGFAVRAAGVNDRTVRVPLAASGPVGPEGPSWIPPPPTEGVWVLKAINGVVQWVEEAWSSSS